VKRNLKLIIERFYLENRRSLYRYALSMVQDTGEAEDLVHGGIEKLVEHVQEHGRPPRHVRCFVVACIRNEAIDLLRKRQSREMSVFDLQQVLNTRTGPPEFEFLARHFQVLTDDEKEVILMKNILGFSLAEIGKIRNVSIFTIATWHRRGIRKLRTSLLEEVINEDA